MRRYGNSTDEYDEEYPSVENEPLNRSRGKFLLSILLLITGAIGSTVAANISLGDGRIEMGQGIYRISACDQWIGIGLYPTAANYSGKSRIQTVEIIGLDPRLCKNVVFNLKFYKNSNLNTALSLFTGVTGTDTSTATTTTGDVDQITLYDSSTVTYPTVSYNSYASKAVSLINKAGVNSGYDDGYHKISYVASSGTYRVYFYQPLCLMEDVDKITVESSNLT